MGFRRINHGIHLSPETYFFCSYPFLPKLQDLLFGQIQCPYEYLYPTVPIPKTWLQTSINLDMIWFHTRLNDIVNQNSCLSLPECILVMCVWCMYCVVIGGCHKCDLLYTAWTAVYIHKPQLSLSLFIFHPSALSLAISLYLHFSVCIFCNEIVCQCTWTVIFYWLYNHSFVYENWYKLDEIDG